MQQLSEVHDVSLNSAEVGTQVPALTHAEAMVLCEEEHRRFQAVIESLTGDEWHKPTACSLWTVKDIVAHQAAHVVSFTSLGNFMGQLNPLAMRPYFRRGMSALDAWNQSQVDVRAGHSPSALIAEIRDATPQSLKSRAGLPALLRGLTLPAPGLDQPRSLGYMFDLIYTRDMWMHRIDICLATDRPVTLDAAHDRRTVALIVRDLALKSRRGLNGRAAILDLTGAGGGRYTIGANTAPEATVTMDPVSFANLTSGREKAGNVVRQPGTALSGDIAFGRSVIDFAENRVLF